MILIFIVLYLIGKRFSYLAIGYGKNNILYMLIGALSYAMGGFIGVFVIGILDTMTVAELVNVSNLQMNLMLLPIGLAVSHMFYKYLELRWSNATVA